MNLIYFSPAFRINHIDLLRLFRHRLHCKQRNDLHASSASQTASLYEQQPSFLLDVA